MNGAVFANEATAELFEDRIHERQNPPESLGVCRVIRYMLRIPVESDGIRNFDRHRPDMHVNVERLQSRHELRIEGGHRLWSELKNSLLAVTNGDRQPVLKEVELDFKHQLFVGNSRRRQAHRVHVQRYFPPMIDSGTQRQPDLADNLRPHM